MMALYSFAGELALQIEVSLTFLKHLTVQQMGLLKVPLHSSQQPSMRRVQGHPSRVKSRQRQHFH